MVPPSPDDEKYLEGIEILEATVLWIFPATILTALKEFLPGRAQFEMTRPNVT